MNDSANVKIGGRLLRIARLGDEYYVPVENPENLLESLRRSGSKADMFTFVQELHDCEPHYPYHCEMDQMAVLPITTYDHWLNQQIRFKPRNKIRKAWKSGMETRVVGFSDELIRGIQEIYNETEIRQGKRNWHFGKDLTTLYQEHATFLDRSEFIGAYYKNELIGFAKVTHSPKYSIIMNIVGKIAHRDKATTNALIAKTVELVASRNISLLNFGVWGRRGLNDFKTASAFECHEVPRYYVPLTRRGNLALKLQLHHGLKERLPEKWIVAAADFRARWNQRRAGASGGNAPASDSTANAVEKN